MAIKRTKYCGNKKCRKPIIYGSHCSPMCASTGKQLKRSWIKKKKQKPIRKLSERRQKEYDEYYRIHPIFLKGKICPITKKPATEIHHKKGKIGKLLIDQRYFLGVTRTGHIWIENNPAEAEKLGYVIKRTASSS